MLTFANQQKTQLTAEDEGHVTDFDKYLVIKQNTLLRTSWGRWDILVFP